MIPAPPSRAPRDVGAAARRRHRVTAHLLRVCWVAGLGCASTSTPAPVQPTVPPPVTVSLDDQPPQEPSTTTPEPEPEPAPALVVEDYTAELADALAKPGWRRSKMRISMVRRGAVRLSIDGPDLGLRDLAPLANPRRMRVIDDGARPRVVIDDGGLRMLLYVERGDAGPVVARASPLRPSPGFVFGDPPRRGHAILRPGAFVDVVAREGAMVQIAYDERATLKGWIESDALNTTATLDDLPADERPAYRTARATKMLARPGGAVLFAIDGDDPVTEVSPTLSRGYRLVEFQPVCHRDFAYVGFVRARDLHQPSFYGNLVGCGVSVPKSERSFGELEGSPRTTIAAGRFFLDPDRPQIVGCAATPVEVVDLGDGRYAVATLWGPIQVRLAPEDFAGTCEP